MRILIVGGGVGGLATAIAMHSVGLEPSVVERRDAVSSEGAAIVIPSNGARALSQLGVLDDVKATSQIVTHFEYVHHNETLISAPLDQGFDGWPWFALARSDLLNALANQAGGVRYGVGVSSAKEQDGAVSVTFTDGSSDQFDVVVGADGTHSRVRMAVDADAHPEWAGLLYWRATVPDASRAPVLRGHIADRSLFGVFPGGPGSVYIWAALPTSSREVDPIAGRRQRVLDRFADLGAEPLEFLSRTTSDADFSCAPPEWVRLDCWHTARIVLIGDAAHASPPFMAEGACLALEDAIVLADCLATDAPPKAFSTYEARRRPRADLVQGLVSRTVESLTNVSGAAARADLFRSMSATALLAQFAPLMEPL